MQTLSIKNKLAKPDESSPICARLLKFFFIHIRNERFCAEKIIVSVSSPPEWQASI